MSFPARGGGYPEPVRQPDDGSQVAGVLHFVQRQHQFFVRICRFEVMAGYLHQRQRVVGRLQQRQPFHVVRAYRLHFRSLEHSFQRKYLADSQARGAQFAYEFFALGHEQPVFRPAPFVGQRPDQLYLCFRHRFLSAPLSGRLFFLS